MNMFAPWKRWSKYWAAPLWSFINVWSALWELSYRSANCSEYDNYNLIAKQGDRKSWEKQEGDNKDEELRITSGVLKKVCS